MPVLIAKLGGHRNSDAIERLTHYMSPLSDIAYAGGRGVIAQNPYSLIESFEFTKKMYEKNEEGRKHISHFVIGTKNEGLITEELLEIANVASEYFYNRGFQNYFVIHRGSGNDPKYLHIHLAVNTVNFRDGKRLYETYSNTSEFCHVLESHFPNLFWTSINDNSSSWD